MRQKQRWITTLMVVGAFVLGTMAQAGAAKLHHAKPVWVLMLMEQQGSKVHVGGVYRSKAEAQAAVALLPPPTADRVEIAVPSTLYPTIAKAHKGGDR
jgi:hypothetical protein